MIEFAGCLDCRECCTFAAEDRYFAPVFTYGEMRRVRARRAKAAFRRKSGSRNVYQPVLVSSRRRPGMFVCPLLDEQTHRCTVYDIRPLDCRLWPFMLVKSPARDAVDLHCFDESLCPCMRTQEPELRNHARERARAFACSPECRDVILAHPDLAWEAEPGTFLVERIPLE